MKFIGLDICLRRYYVPTQHRRLENMMHLCEISIVSGLPTPVSEFIPLDQCLCRISPSTKVLLLAQSQGYVFLSLSLLFGYLAFPSYFFNTQRSAYSLYCQFENLLYTLTREYLNQREQTLC